MGALGRQRVEQELSWEHSRRNLLAAYETLLARGGRCERARCAERRGRKQARYATRPGRRNPGCSTRRGRA